MPGVSRKGDVCTGHGCYGSRPSAMGSPNVSTNSIPTHRQTDGWNSHCCGLCHGSTTASGSATVYVNSKQIARIGDPVACGSAIAQGSSNVFAGDSGEKFVPKVWPTIKLASFPAPKLKDTSAPAGKNVSTPS